MVLHKHTFVFVIDILPLGGEESDQRVGVKFHSQIRTQLW